MITPLLVTYVISVVSIYMGFQELAPISSKLIFILLTLLYISKINYSYSDFDSVIIIIIIFIESPISKKV